MIKSAIVAPAIDAMDTPSEKYDPLAEIADETSEDLAPNLLLGPYEGRNLGDYFGLTHFGIAMDILPPGSKSAMRHWHTKSDEIVMILEGELVLITDAGETTMTAGMIAGFKAGDENGHHLINRSNKPAKLLVAGSRVQGDEVHYPDDDFQWLTLDDATRIATKKDGTRY